jgi:hypothetical protein
MPPDAQLREAINVWTDFFAGCQRIAAGSNRPAHWT